jgi:hypothetical protein
MIQLRGEDLETVDGDERVHGMMSTMAKAITRRDVLRGVACAAAVAGLTPLAAWGAGADDCPLSIVQAMADAGCFGELTYASAASSADLPQVCRWMSVGRDDRIVRLVAENRESGSPRVLLRTARGRLIELGSGAGPAFSLHGTRGSFRRTAAEGDMVYLHGRAHRWEPLSWYGQMPASARGVSRIDDSHIWRTINARVSQSLAAGGAVVELKTV